MGNPLVFTGGVRGQITSYSLAEMKSGSVALNVKVHVFDCYDEESSQWVDYREHDYEAEGTFWLVKKDGTLSHDQIQALVQHCGWDANFESITNKTWKPTPASFAMQEDNYQEQKRYRIAFPAAYDATPGLGTISPEKAKMLQNQHGAALRALAGNVVRAAAPVPNGKPTPPVAPKRSPNLPRAMQHPFPDPNAQPAVDPETGEVIPF
jgi:hypothetical protein